MLPELPVLYRVACSLSANPFDAEDLVQDTLVRAYRAIDQFDGRHPRAWLLTIMRHTNINRHRRQRPTVGVGGVDAAEQANLIASPGATVEDSATGGELGEELERALAELAPRLADAVRLVDVDGLSYDEAAAVLGIPTGTLTSRLHRARRSLRASLDRSTYSRRTAS